MNSMSQQIFKYGTPTYPGKFVLELPVGAVFLSAQNQRGLPVLWFRVNTDNPTEERSFYWLETGKEYPPDHKYLATVQLMLEQYVLHLLKKQK